MSKAIFLYLLILIVLVAGIFNYAHKYYYIYKENRMMEVALDVARSMLVKMQKEKEKFLLLEAKLVQATTDNEIFKGQKDELVLNVQNLEKKITEAKAGVDKMNEEISALKKKIEDLEKEKLELASQILSLKSGTVEVLSPND